MSDAAQEPADSPIQIRLAGGLTMPLIKLREESLPQSEGSSDWNRALPAFGYLVADAHLKPVTAGETQGYADRDWNRCAEVAAALREISQGRKAQRKLSKWSSAK